MAIPSTLTHPSGVTKTVYTGWSWTAFWFGIFVPAIRGDFKWAGICFGVAIFNMILSTVGVGFITAIVWWFVFGAKYNEWHRNDLLLKGFVPAAA